MLPVRVWPALVLLASAATQELPPFELPADVAARVRGLTDAEPLQLLAALGGMDLVKRAAAQEPWQELDARARCALVRAGLRSTDREVAIGAAAMAGEGEWLDTKEQKRAATVGMARCNAVDTPFDVGAFFAMLDARDTALFLANPGEMPREVPEFFGILHHRFGPEHGSQVELLSRSDDVLVRQGAARYLGVMHAERSRYAHFLLSQPLREPELPPGFDPQTQKQPFVPRPFTLRPAGDGWPPLLAAVIELVFLTEGVETLGGKWFAWHWARDAKPGAIDRPLVGRLLACGDVYGQRIGMIGLRQVGCDDAPALLRRLAAQADGEQLAPLQALVDLARAGDAAARRRLGQLAEDKGLALALLWQADRPGVIADVVARAMGTDACTGLVALQRLEEAATLGRWWSEPMAGLDDELLVRCAHAPLDGPRLALLLEEFPELRTKALCDKAIALLGADSIESMPLGVLELADAQALAQALHRLLARDDVSPGVRELAVPALARLGAAGLGDAAQTEHLWQQAGKVRNDEDRALCRIRLAATGNAAIAANLRTMLGDAAWAPGWETAGRVAALAAAGGVPTRLCITLAGELRECSVEALGKARQSLYEPLRAGDGAGAMARYLAARPLEEGWLGGLWELAGAGPAYLRRCRDEREHKLCCWATGELARAGDAEARAEVESAIERRLYGWIDALDDDALTDGNNLERVPLLLRQVESNCCTFAVISSAIEDVFECDPFEPEEGARSRPDQVRDAWRQVQGRLAWSRIANRWLIAPK